MPASLTDAPVTHVASGAPGSDADRSRELAFRRSLRTSRTRRGTAALRRRRVLRSRRSLLAAAAGLVMLSAGAVAESRDGSSAGGLSKQTIKAAQTALGVKADGVVGPQTRKVTRSFQRKNKLEVDGILGSQTLKALGVEVPARAEPAAATDEAEILARIAQCESGGDPKAVSASGRYRGKYQFDRSTWRSVGGEGNPAAAPEEEQDRRAAKLLRRSGTAPWPNCA